MQVAKSFVATLTAGLGMLAGCSADTSSPGPTPEGKAYAATEWCSHGAAGPSGMRDLRVDLSAAHAGVRFFGVQRTFGEVDQALAASLATAEPITEGHLVSYAARLVGAACRLQADATPLGPARVDTVGRTAIVRPGTGEVTLDPGAQTIVVDLRGLAAVDGLRGALEAAVAPALATPIPRATSHVRRHTGMTDGPHNQSIYKNEVVNVTQEPIPAKGTADRPLVLLTGAALAPEAAELAITLRLANRAWIVGETVFTEAAESRWSGVGSSGIAWRANELWAGDRRWPDEVRADLRSDDPERTAIDTAEWRPPPRLGADNERGERGKRAALGPITSTDKVQPKALGHGETRAALIATHGALRLFFPYFEDVGDRIDERLVETLATVEDAPTMARAAFRDVLRRFGEAIRDGHNFVLDYGSPSSGFLGIATEDIDGEAVVRRSMLDDILPGDTIVRIAGEDARAWYAREFLRTSAASDGYRFDLASRYYETMAGPTDFELRASDGAKRTVTATPVAREAYAKFGSAPSLRAAGWLTELGGADLYYINLTQEVLTKIEDFRAELTKAKSAKGLVLDMRGYPVLNHYEVASRIIPRNFSSPVFNIPVRLGPAGRYIESGHYDLTPLTNPSYDGPIVLLVGHSSVSAAENFSTMLVDAQRLKAVIGRRSAATNGNITTLQLPGAFAFGFTGMEVRHADGSPFHGIGIVPDTDVALTATDFRDGKDPELARAIQVLSVTE